MSVTFELARYVSGLTYKDLPPDVAEKTKRFILDTIGCAIGGYDSKASQILERVIRNVGGAGEATIIGSGLKTSSHLASLANGTMARYLDYNDTAFIKTEEGYKTDFHPSDVIPSILAIAESRHLSGKDVITATVLGYDLSFRFLNAIIGAGIEKRGWNIDIRGAYIVPLLAGKMLGLSELQMQNAVGICASCHAVFGILDSPSEELTMTKNIRFSAMASDAIFSAKLAGEGFTGPEHMIEGDGGFVDVIMKGDYDLNKLRDPKDSYIIRNACSIKSIIGDYSTHGHLSATLTLVNDHEIHPDDIAEIKIKTSHRCVAHTGGAAKKYPRNKETADHSSYYLTAIAILDRQLGPDQFSPEKYADGRVLNLIEKVILEGDKEFDAIRPAGMTEIITKQGDKYASRVDYPKGHPRNPMTDDELVAKFESMATKHLGGAQISRIIDTVLKLEAIDDVGELMGLLVFRNRGEGEV